MKMRNKFTELMKKYKQILMYLIFGVATTVVNWLVYALLVGVFSADITLSNAVAWLISVIFAFITNKILVFESKSWRLSKTIKEIATFFGSRIISGIVEIIGPAILFSAGIDQEIFGIKGFAAKILVSVVVVILNYVLSKLVVFRKNKRDRDPGQGLIYAAAFLIPAAVVIAILFVSKCVPFGPNSIAIYDAQIQYLDFFQYLRNVLNAQDSFYYSFSHFLGSTGIATFAYYLASPFNILILLFKSGQETLFFTVLVVLKIATCGLTSCIYLKNRFKQLPVSFVLMLSSCFALMQYNFAQSSNIMWLDGVYMLPLLLLGVYRLIQSGRSGLFVISLCLTVLFNWYSGYFDCIAVLIYFFFELLVMHREFSVKQKLNRFVRIALHSVAGLALSSALLLPAFISLGSGKGQLSIDFQNTFSGNILNVFSGLATGSVSSSGFVVLFCGSLVFFGAALYFFDRRFSRHERAYSLAFAVLMVLLAYYQPFEYIMNGFRYAYSYWYRYAYIIVFFFIYLAAREYEYVRQTSGRGFVVCGLCCSALLLLSNYVTGSGNLTRIAETILVLIIVSLLLYKYGRKHGKRIISVCLIIVVSAELLVNGYQVYQHMGYYNADEYKEYVSTETALISQLKQYDDSFYRIAQTTYRETSDYRITANYDESLAYGYNSITHYSSTFENTQAVLMNRLGYSSMTDISINNTRILSSDALLGVKYIISDAPIRGLDEISELTEYRGMKTYYNPFALNSAVIYRDSDICAEYADNPFEYQNQLYSQLLGRRVSVFKKMRVQSRQMEDETQFDIPAYGEDEIVYFYISTDGWANGAVYANEDLISGYSCWLTPFVLMLPSSEEKTTVRFTNTGEGDGILGYEFYVLNLSVLREICNELNRSVPEALTIENGKVSVTINSESGNRLLLQVPVNKGWTVLLNGEPTEDIREYADCLYSIGLRDGINEIKMTYSIPGLKAGIIISAGTLLCLVAGWFVLRRKK